MLQINKDVQRSLYRLASALTSMLQAPANGEEGDPRWSVEAISASSWKINHPDLPFLQEVPGEPDPAIFLLVVDRIDNGSWIVSAQNRMASEGNDSPKVLIVEKRDDPPGDSWDIAGIASRAARFFQQERADVQGTVQALNETPQTLPALDIQDKAEGGPPMGPFASSRLRRIANAIHLKNEKDFKRMGGLESMLKLGVAFVAENRGEYGRRVGAVVGKWFHAYLQIRHGRAAAAILDKDRILLLGGSDLREFSRILLELKDKGMRKQAERLAELILSYRNMLAETSGGLRRNRVGGEVPSGTPKNSTMIGDPARLRHPSSLAPSRSLDGEPRSFIQK